MRRWFNVHDTRVCVDAADEDLAKAVTRYLEPFITDEGRPADYTIRIQRGPLVQGPSVLPPTCEIAPGLEGYLIWDQDLTWCSAPDQFMAVTDPSKGISELTIAPACTSAARGLAAIHVIDRMLDATGRQLLHGAALLLPDHNQAILIFGKSGMGKTTTCLSLAHHGYRLLTDDAIVLQKTAPAHWVWGLPRPVKVHRRTGHLLPVLQPILGETWDAEDEQSIELEDLSRVLSVGDHAAYEVAALVLLGNRSKADHVIEGLSKAEALREVLLDNLHRHPGRDQKQQSKRFAALGSLFLSVPAVRLCVGTDLTALGDRMGDVLRPAKA